MHRLIAALVLTLLLAACGSQPEQVVPTQITFATLPPQTPTRAEAINAPTSTTDTQSIPTLAPLPAQRNIVSLGDEPQFLVVSAVGAQAGSTPLGFEAGD
jgi:uncharacterized lipoprotein YbaY